MWHGLVLVKDKGKQSLIEGKLLKGNFSLVLLLDFFLAHGVWHTQSLLPLVDLNKNRLEQLKFLKHNSMMSFWGFAVLEQFQEQFLKLVDALGLNALLTCEDLVAPLEEAFGLVGLIWGFR